MSWENFEMLFAFYGWIFVIILFWLLPPHFNDLHLYLSDIFCFFLQEWGVTHLTFEYDSEPFGKERDAAIVKLAKEAGVEVTTENSHTLYDLDR